MGSNQTDVQVKVLPTVGRIVHYIPTPGAANVHCAADVVNVNDDGTLMLYVKNPELRTAEFIDRVVEDQSGNQSGTWHWPERS